MDIRLLKSVFVLLVCLCTFSTAVVVNETLNTNEKYIFLHEFGFLEGGNAHINITTQPDNAQLYFLFCTENQNTELFGFGTPEPCKIGITNQTCELSVQFQGHLELDKNVTKYGVYYLYLANCDALTITGNAYYTLVNPAGQHLGFGYIPLPALFTILTGTWFVISVLWCFTWIKNKTVCTIFIRQQSIKFYSVVSIFPIVKFVYAIIGVFYWGSYARDGSVSVSAFMLYGFLYILMRSVFYSVLLLIATGWGVLRDSLESEKYVIGGTIGGLIATLIAGFLLHGLFILLTFVIYIVVIVLIFRYINYNLYRLETEGSNRPDVSRIVVQDKEEMFKTFKVIMLAYIAIVMVIALFEIMFLLNYPWVTEMLYELLELTVFICIGYTFRQKPPGYHRTDNYDDTDQEEAIQMDTQPLRDRQNDHNL
mmetsp:Transcript_24310/g.34099  ORF Transcript_24310/g.34099 Transcript_24310/m.34099 type:complete len:424 (+) Transcript_24310:85-1356(+)